MLLLWRFTVMGEMLSARAISLSLKRWAKSASTSNSRLESGSIRLGWRGAGAGPRTAGKTSRSLAMNSVCDPRAPSW